MQNSGIKAGQDTLILNNYVFTTQGINDAYNLEFNEDTVMVDVGNTGTLLASKNAKGPLATLTIAVPISSSDDLQLEQWWTQTINDFTGLGFLQGTYTRISVNTNNSIIRTAYGIIGGSITKGAGMKTNSTGDVTQMIATWTIVGVATRVSN